MAITFNKADGLNDSIFGKSMEPVMMTIERQAEALEKKSAIPKLFKMAKSKNFAEKIASMTSMKGFMPVGEGGMIGSNMLDVGIYMPTPEVLKSVRDEIFDNGEAVLAAIAQAHDRAGFELDRSNSLKRTPVGYPAGSEWDDYLKLKDLHISKTVDDAYILSPGLAERAAADFHAAYDFMTLAGRAARFAHEEI